MQLCFLCLIVLKNPNFTFSLLSFYYNSKYDYIVYDCLTIKILTKIIKVNFLINCLTFKKNKNTLTSLLDKTMMKEKKAVYIKLENSKFLKLAL